jgi:transportin-3
MRPTSHPCILRLTTQITYDIQQIPAGSVPELRDQILGLLKLYAPGPRPIRTQLCVCLAILAIQMTGWKDVVPMVVSALGNEAESHACILPEEVTEGRKINLTVCGPKDTILRASGTLGWQENTNIRI